MNAGTEAIIRDYLAHSPRPSDDLDTLATAAIAGGIEPKLAPQVASAAIEACRHTDAAAGDVLVAFLRVAAKSDAKFPGDLQHAGWAIRALYALCNAVRHAVRFARRTLLRR